MEASAAASAVASVAASEVALAQDKTHTIRTIKRTVKVPKAQSVALAAAWFQNQQSAAVVTKK